MAHRIDAVRDDFIRRRKIYAKETRDFSRQFEIQCIVVFSDI